MSSGKEYDGVEWEEDMLSSRQVQSLNGCLYSAALLREAKRLQQLQQKEHAPLIQAFQKRQRLSER